MKSDKLREARAIRGLSMQAMADALGISFNTYQKYEYSSREPSYDTLSKMADILGVTTDYLLGRPEAKPPKDALEYLFKEKSFEDIEEELLRSYMQLPHEARMVVVQLLNDVAEKATQKKAQPSAEKIIILSTKKSRYSVSAGTGYDLNDSDAWDRVNVADCPEARKADFIVEIDGDSMEPTYHDGDNVFVKSTPDVEIGQIGIFIVDRQGYIKELGDGKLISHNEKYDPIELKDTDNICVGAVLGIAKIVDD